MWIGILLDTIQTSTIRGCWRLRNSLTGTSTVEFSTAGHLRHCKVGSLRSTHRPLFGAFVNFSYHEVILTDRSGSLGSFQNQGPQLERYRFNSMEELRPVLSEVIYKKCGLVTGHYSMYRCARIAAKDSAATTEPYSRRPDQSKVLDVPRLTFFRSRP